MRRNFNLRGFKRLFFGILFPLVLTTNLSWLTSHTSTSKTFIYGAAADLVYTWVIILRWLLWSSSFLSLKSIVEMRIKTCQILCSLILWFWRKVSISVTLRSHLNRIVSLVLACSRITRWNHVSLLTWRVDYLRLTFRHIWRQMLKWDICILRNKWCGVTSVLRCWCCFWIFWIWVGPSCMIRGNCQGWMPIFLYLLNFCANRFILIDLLSILVTSSISWARRLREVWDQAKLDTI